MRLLVAFAVVATFGCSQNAETPQASSVALYYIPFDVETFAAVGLLLALAANARFTAVAGQPTHYLRHRPRALLTLTCPRVSGPVHLAVLTRIGGTGGHPWRRRNLRGSTEEMEQPEWAPGRESSGDARAQSGRGSRAEVAPERFLTTATSGSERSYPAMPESSLKSLPPPTTPRCGHG